MTNETTAPDRNFRCCGCGKIWTENHFPCECLTDVLYQRDGKNSRLKSVWIEAKEATDLEAAQARIAELEGALERVMVGGNHLALIIGADHPPFDAGVIWAMNVYGASTDKYNAWCCWSEIMKARAALEGKG